MKINWARILIIGAYVLVIYLASRGCNGDVPQEIREILRVDTFAIRDTLYLQKVVTKTNTVTITEFFEVRDTANMEAAGRDTANMDVVKRDTLEIHDSPNEVRHYVGENTDIVDGDTCTYKYRIGAYGDPVYLKIDSHCRFTVRDTAIREFPQPKRLKIGGGVGFDTQSRIIYSAMIMKDNLYGGIDYSNGGYFGARIGLMFGVK